MPLPSFQESLKCLDYRRLGKQRLEARQIHTTITENRKAWSNHPAVLMWVGYERALARYYNACLKEWIKRGYNNNMKPISVKGRVKMPFWMGRESFHSSHRKVLLFKDHQWYSQFGWSEEPEYNYEWPVRKNEN